MTTITSDSTAALTALQTTQDASLRLGSLLELESLTRETATYASELCGLPVMILRLDTDSERLIAAASSQPINELNKVRLALTDVPLVSDWNASESTLLTQEKYPADSALGSLLVKMGVTTAYAIPLVVKATRTWVGVLLVATDTPSRTDALRPVLDIAAGALRNAITHNRVVDQLAAKTHELALTRRVDRELNDTMKQRHVFEIALDWAMRVTLAQAASLALYDQSSDELRYAMDIGYERPADQIALLRKTVGGGIAHRVARSGHTEVIPDVTVDSDYLELSTIVKSHTSVPVMREDRVIAVISVESKRLNAFNDDHIDFIEKLATRAGVAIDNARLYADALREREKYSLILGATSDIVLAIGHDDRIIQINPAAVAALHLYADRDYVGQLLADVLETSTLYHAFKRIKPLSQPNIEEVTLSDGRVYHVNFTPHDQIGWIIVAHDITNFKETDQLKSELIATVSHDLRQPLTIMSAYVDLLTLHKSVDERGERYIKYLLRSIQNMRHLIEDLLDLANIESGMQLKTDVLNIKTVIDECVDNVQPSAEAKSMTLVNDVPGTLPQITGDHQRLVQIFNNLVSNAIKYTPPEGTVRVWAEQRDNTLRIAVQDNGMGISPQDQARIFDRFFRVRNAENESIEGTGLGLAIVKKLVDAHKGQIGLESRLGQGSTFFVTLPILPV